MSQKLYEHPARSHQPRNVHAQQVAEQEAATFNKRVAIRLTGLFRAMSTFWVIVGSILLWILANATLVRFDPLPWPLLLCLCSVPQLPLMIVIMVGQGLISRHQELQAEEQYQTTQATYQMLAQLVAHLHAQDDVLLYLRRTQELILDKLGIDADPTTDGRMPAIRMGNHLVLNEEEQRLSLARFIKPDMLEGLPPAVLLLLEQYRPHSQEARHGDV